eukprot:6207967-Pleurochrysis_carterae.AAC.2
MSRSQAHVATPPLAHRFHWPLLTAVLARQRGKVCGIAQRGARRRRSRGSCVAVAAPRLYQRLSPPRHATSRSRAPARSKPAKPARTARCVLSGENAMNLKLLVVTDSQTTIREGEECSLCKVRENFRHRVAARWRFHRYIANRQWGDRVKDATRQ